MRIILIGVDNKKDKSNKLRFLTKNATLIRLSDGIEIMTGKNYKLFF